MLNKLILLFFAFSSIILCASNIKNIPYYKKLSNRVYFRILNLPGDLKKGEIFLDKKDILEITDYSGNLDAVKTTYFTAGKLQLLLDKGIKPDDIGIDKDKNGAFISIKGNKFLSINERESMLRYQIPAFKLAFIFSCKLKNALGDKKDYHIPEFSRQYKKLNNGDEYFANNLYEDAYLAYRKAWKYDRDYMLAYYSMGAVAFYMNKYKEAMEFLEKATTLDPKFSRAYYLLAQAAFKKKDYQKALFSIKIALKLMPGITLYSDLLSDILNANDKNLITKEVNINLSDLEKD